MIAQAKARLIAAVAAPLFLLHAQPARCAPKAETVATVLPHISITTIGEGSPVVLIPGLASPRTVWDGVAAHIAAGRRVILVQVNGFGGDAPGANLKPGVLDGIVADLHAYLTAQKLAKPAVIGHSMGGLVGLMLAKAHPEDVGRLMIVDSLPFFGVLTSPGSDVTVDAVRPLATQMRDKVAARYGKPIDPATAGADTAGMTLKPENRARLAAWGSAADPRVTAEAMYEDLTTDLRPDLARIATPITLVYPWSEARFGKERTGMFYRQQYVGAPHIAYVDIGESAHFVMLDQPAAFTTAVDAFLG